MPTKQPSPHVLGAEELQLLASLDDIATNIAAVAAKLPPAEAENYIERELARTAVAMRKYEGKCTAPAASVGFAIDVCLRERIKAKLAGWGGAQ